MNNYTVIIRPVSTEKSSKAHAEGQYTFLVNKTASKVDIKNAVKKLYGVDVKTVRTMITPRKTRLVRGGHEMIKRPNYKKAVVTLKGKALIDPNKLKIAKDNK